MAVSFFDERITDWFLLALGTVDRPKSWADLKDTLMRHFGANNYRAGVQKLRKIKQSGTIQDYLLEFNVALAECPGLPEEEKKEIFVDGLKPDIALNIRGHDDLTMSQIIDRAVRMSYQPGASTSSGKDWHRRSGERTARRSEQTESSSPEYRPRRPPRHQDRSSGRKPEIKRELPRFGSSSKPTTHYKDKGYRSEHFNRSETKERAIRSTERAEEKRETGDSGPSWAKCFKCGERGHMAVQCPFRDAKN